jgi:antitoxin component of MazEF toxin-antitoxin module
MKIELVRIGNSRGIRIPKPLIEQCGFGDTVEVHVEQDRLVIAQDHAPRQDGRKPSRRQIYLFQKHRRSMLGMKMSSMLGNGPSESPSTG